MSNDRQWVKKLKGPKQSWTQEVRMLRKKRVLPNTLLSFIGKRQEVQINMKRKSKSAGHTSSDNTDLNLNVNKKDSNKSQVQINEKQTVKSTTKHNSDQKLYSKKVSSVSSPVFATEQIENDSTNNESTNIDTNASPKVNPVSRLQAARNKANSIIQSKTDSSTTHAEKQGVSSSKFLSPEAYEQNPIYVNNKKIGMKTPVSKVKENKESNECTLSPSIKKQIKACRVLLSPLPLQSADKYVNINESISKSGSAQISDPEEHTSYASTSLNSVMDINEISQLNTSEALKKRKRTQSPSEILASNDNENPLIIINTLEYSAPNLKISLDTGDNKSTENKAKKMRTEISSNLMTAAILSGIDESLTEENISYKPGEVNVEVHNQEASVELAETSSVSYDVDSNIEVDRNSQMAPAKGSISFQKSTAKKFESKNKKKMSIDVSKSELSKAETLSSPFREANSNIVVDNKMEPFQASMLIPENKINKSVHFVPPVSMTVSVNKPINTQDNTPKVNVQKTDTNNQANIPSNKSAFEKYTPVTNATITEKTDSVFQISFDEDPFNTSQDKSADEAYLKALRTILGNDLSANSPASTKSNKNTTSETNKKVPVNDNASKRQSYFLKPQIPDEPIESISDNSVSDSTIMNFVENTPVTEYTEKLLQSVFSQGRSNSPSVKTKPRKATVPMKSFSSKYISKKPVKNDFDAENPNDEQIYSNKYRVTEQHGSVNFKNLMKKTTFQQKVMKSSLPWSQLISSQTNNVTQNKIFQSKNIDLNEELRKALKLPNNAKVLVVKAPIPGMNMQGNPLLQDISQKSTSDSQKSESVETVKDSHNITKINYDESSNSSSVTSGLKGTKKGLSNDEKQKKQKLKKALTLNPTLEYEIEEDENENERRVYNKIVTEDFNSDNNDIITDDTVIESLTSLPVGISEDDQSQNSCFSSNTQQSSINESETKAHSKESLKFNLKVLLRNRTMEEEQSDDDDTENANSRDILCKEALTNNKTVESMDDFSEVTNDGAIEKNMATEEDMACVIDSAENLENEENQVDHLTDSEELFSSIDSASNEKLDDGQIALSGCDSNDNVHRHLSHSTSENKCGIDSITETKYTRKVFDNNTEDLDLTITKEREVNNEKTLASITEESAIINNNNLFLRNNEQQLSSLHKITENYISQDNTSGQRQDEQQTFSAFSSQETRSSGSVGNKQEETDQTDNDILYNFVENDNELDNKNTKYKAIDLKKKSIPFKINANKQRVSSQISTYDPNLETSDEDKEIFPEYIENEPPVIVNDGGILPNDSAESRKTSFVTKSVTINNRPVTDEISEHSKASFEPHEQNISQDKDSVNNKSEKEVTESYDYQSFKSQFSISDPKKFDAENVQTYQDAAQVINYQDVSDSGSILTTAMVEKQLNTDDLIYEIKFQLQQAMEEDIDEATKELNKVEQEITSRRKVLNEIQEQINDQSLKMDQVTEIKQKQIFRIQCQLKEAQEELQKYPWKIIIDKAKDAEKTYEKKEKELKTLERKVSSAKGSLGYYLSEEGIKKLTMKNEALEKTIKENRAKLDALQYCIEEAENNPKPNNATGRGSAIMYTNICELLEKSFLPQSIARRANNPTSRVMINDKENIDRRMRNAETKKVLEYIHGSKEAAMYGAVDYLVNFGTTSVMRDLAILFKKAQAERQVEFDNKEESKEMKLDGFIQDRRRKYNHFLPKRKYKFLCKSHSSVSKGAENDEFGAIPNIPNIRLREGRTVNIMNLESSIDTFNKFLGPLFQIPKVLGISRTVTCLALMIANSLTRVTNLEQQLVWLDDLPNHFIFQFSDEGGPEDKQLQLAMSIGVLTCWNLGGRRHSPEHQYLLHGCTVPEKERTALMTDVWKQHTDEMLVIEGCVFTIQGKKSTFSFEPSADMAWHNWAANDTSQLTQFPSVYANVTSDNIATPSGYLGLEHSSTWKPFTHNQRIQNAKGLECFLKGLDKNMPMAERLLRRKEYMMSKGIRQLGQPRISTFVECLRPEPSQCEVAIVTHTLNLLMKEAFNRKKITELSAILSADVAGHSLSGESNTPGERYGYTYGSKKCIPIKAGTKGCGLPHIGKLIYVQYNTYDKSEVDKNFKVTLTLKDAIVVSQYWHLIVDTLKCVKETENQKIVRFAYGKTGEYIREAIDLIYATQTNYAGVERVHHLLKMVYNIILLFIGRSAVNTTVWTMCQALPYHMKKLYDQYRTGYGMVVGQTKSANLNCIKQDLQEIKESKPSKLGRGRWWQLSRLNFSRCFYLTEHEFVPYPADIYIQRSPTPPDSGVCQCGRKKIKNETEVTCLVCDDRLIMAIVQAAIMGKPNQDVKEVVDLVADNVEKKVAT